MKITLPEKLDLFGAISFCSQLIQMGSDRLYCFDYGNIKFFEPFGMLLTGSSIRSFIKAHPRSDIFGINYESLDYAAHMGFFESIGLEFGKKPGEAKGNDNYIPVTFIELETIEKEAMISNQGIGTTIYNKAQTLSDILARGDISLSSHLTYSIAELIRNVIEHSRSDTIWFTGQYWKKSNIVEIGILDEGIGIKSSLTATGKYKISNDFEAVELSLEPGISGANYYRINEESFSNAGFGLYNIKNISQKAGIFSICSGTCALDIIGTKYHKYTTSFQGTGIRVRINVSEIDDLSSQLPRIVSEGRKLARLNHKIKQTSVSTMFDKH
jgi:anti-sigma regulatory factor (Ser/Thr protein kinase)